MNSIGSLTNGLAGTNRGAADQDNILNGFNDGDTDNSSAALGADTLIQGSSIQDNPNTDVGASPILGTPGPTVGTGANQRGFNEDVADDTGGYDLTHVGAVRSGADANSTQFNSRTNGGWTVSTAQGEGFAVPAPAL